MLSGGSTTSGFRYTIVSNGMSLEQKAVNTWSIVEGDPLSAFNRGVNEMTLARGDWAVRIETDSTLTADADTFHVMANVNAYEGDRRVFTRAWARQIPRDLV